jgi:hypothetical protein
MVQATQFEAEATAICTFQPTVIPGVLQTRAYASAVVDLWSGELSASERTARLEVRIMRRDQLFNRPDPPDYRVVLDESVLLREVGGPELMSEQLYDLLDMARTTPITIRVMPLKHVTAYAIGGLFVIFTSDDEDVALYRESHLTDDIAYVSERLRRHRRIFERIWHESMPAEASTRLIEAKAAEMRSAVDRQAARGPAG